MGKIYLKFDSVSIDSLEEFKTFLQNGEKVNLHRVDIADKVRRGIVINWLRQKEAKEWVEQLSCTNMRGFSDTEAIRLLLGIVGGDLNEAVLNWKEYLNSGNCVVSYEESKLSFLLSYDIVKQSNDLVPVVLLINDYIRIERNIDLRKLTTKGRLEFSSIIHEKYIFSVKVFVGGEPITFKNEIPVEFDGSYLIKAYSSVSDIKCFGQGYALIRLESTKLWHFLGMDGKISEEGYEDAHHFSSDGYAAVKRNGSWGFINRSFKCVTGYVYKKVGDFSEGLAYYEKEKSDGVVTIERGFMNTALAVAVDLSYNYKGVGLFFDDCFKCGLFKIWSWCHCEWIDHNGHIVAKIDDMNRKVHNFHSMSVGELINGAAKVEYSFWRTPYETISCETHFIVKENRFVRSLGDFSDEGLSISREIVNLRQAEDYDGTIFYIEDYSDFGYVNYQGDYLTKLIYKRAGSFSEHFAAVSLDGAHWGFVNNRFNPICDFIYSAARHFSEGYAAVLKEGKWGFINNKGENEIHCEYDEVDHFSEGLAPVKKNNKWGFINQEGILVIPCVYDRVTHFSEGFCEVQFDGCRLFIDKVGHPLSLLSPPKEKSISNQYEQKKHSDDSIMSHESYDYNSYLNDRDIQDIKDQFFLDTINFL